MTRRVWAATVLLIAGGVSAAVGASLAGEEPASAFADSSDGEGAVALRHEAAAQGIETRRIVSSSRLLASDASADPSRTVVVAVAPERPYAIQEAASLDAFMRGGGRVLVADAFGQGNSLTAPYGVSFERVRLVAPGDHVAIRFEGRDLTVASASATALFVDEDATGVEVLADAPRPAYVDRNGDGVIDAADPPGPFPFVARVSVGDLGGALVVVAATTPFTDDATADGSAFRRAVLDVVMPDGGLLVFDETSTSEDPVLTGLAAALRFTVSPWALAAFGAAALVVLAAWLVRDQPFVQHVFRPHVFLRRDQGAAAVEAPRTGAQWTARGRTFAALAALATFGALQFGSAQAGALAALLVLVCAASLVHAAPSLRVQQHVAVSRCQEDTDIEVRAEFARRAGVLPSLHVKQHLPPSFEVTRGTAWGTIRGTVPRAPVGFNTKPSRLGRYEVGPLMVRREDPLGLRAHQRIAAPPQWLEVTPRRSADLGTPFRSRALQILLGGHIVNRAGQGAEFHSLRDYVPGDPVRSINWRASARSPGIVVNQRVHESTTTTFIVFDARAVSDVGPASRTPFVSGARAVANIVAAASRARDSVRVFVYGTDIEEVRLLEASRRLTDLENHLSTIRPAGAVTGADAMRQVGPHIRQGAPLVWVSGLEGDDTADEAMRLARSRGANCFVVAPVVQTRGVDGDADERGAPATEAAQAAAIARLRGQGVAVVRVEPDRPLEAAFAMGVAA